MKRFKLGLLAAAIMILITPWQTACRPAEEDPGEPVSEVKAVALPGTGELAGWTMVSEAETFGPENLWDYINGQAESYLGYGFLRIDTAEYRRESGPPAVVVEIYQMGSSENAFGIFAAERNPEDRQVGIGSGGYLGPNVLNFWQGERYIKLTSFEEGAGIEEALSSLAQEISSWCPAGSGELVAFAFFPDEGRIEGGERYISQSFLGQEYLDGAYRVDYEGEEGDGFQLFLVPFNSNDEARTALARYADFLTGQGREVERSEGEAPALVAEVEGTQVVFVQDEYLAGVLGAASRDLGLDAAGELRERIAGRR